MPLKRKQAEESEEEGEEQNEGLRGNAPAAGAASGSGTVLFGGVSCSTAGYRAVRKPFKVGWPDAAVPMLPWPCNRFATAHKQRLAPCCAAAAGVAPRRQRPRRAGERQSGQLAGHPVVLVEVVAP